MSPTRTWGYRRSTPSFPGPTFWITPATPIFAQHVARTLVRGLPAEALHGEMRRLHDTFGPRYDLTFFLAHSLELQEQPQAALEFYHQALGEHPAPQEIASIYIHMASCLKDLGDYAPGS